jgi:hypothetical protein
MGEAVAASLAANPSPEGATTLGRACTIRSY